MRYAEFRGRRRWLLGIAAAAVAGCASSSSNGVAIEAFTYHSAKGTLEIDVKVIDPESGTRVRRLNPEAFSVTVGDEHRKPSVRETGDGYRLTTSAERRSTAPSFEVSVRSSERTLKGTYAAPFWALDYAFRLIVYLMAALSAALVAKAIYFAVRRFGYLRRSSKAGKATSAASQASAAAVAAAQGAPPPPTLMVRLTSVKGAKNQIRTEIRTSSLLGSEDRNWQLPFVKIEGEGFQPAHAEIGIEGNQAFVRNIAGTQVKLDGTPVAAGARAILHQGSRLKIGLIEFEVALADVRPDDGHE